MAIPSRAEKMHYPAAFLPRHEYISPGHFRTDPSYFTVREKGTTDWLVIYTVAGQGRIGHADGESIVGPGDVVLWPPRTPHDYRIAPDCRSWEILWAHFIPWPHWRELMEWPRTSDGVRMLSVDDRHARDRIRECLEDMNGRAGRSLNRGHYFAMNALEKALLLLDECNPSSAETRIDGRVRNVLEYLRRRMTERITIATLARSCGISPSRLAHLFSGQLGTTPLRYLEDIRLDHAARLLLHTDLAVKTVADLCGFSSPYYFSRRFSLRMKLSPRSWRRKGSHRGTTPLARRARTR